MANQEQQTKNSTPLILIGLVFVVAIIGGWWFYASSKDKPAANVKTASNTTNPQAPDQTNNAYKNAPLGAQPPNSLGSPTALVTVEEFADFQCPTCASVHTLMKQINSLYGGRIQFIYRNFPLTQMHDKAFDAAVAAEAAGAQGKYWDMQNLLFTNQQTWASSPEYRTLFEGYAQEVGLDVEQFKSDVLKLTTKSRVDADMQRGRAIGVNATPSLYINGKPVPFNQMSVEGISGIIDYELKIAQSQNQNQSNSATTQTTAPKEVESTNKQADKENIEKPK